MSHSVHHTHSHHHHHETHSGATLALRDIVVGLSDGLTVPFALSAGLSGAVNSNAIVLVAGIAEIVAGTISMGLGGYLAGQTEIDHYAGEEAREYQEVKDIPMEEEREIKEILAAYGISEQTQTQVAKELAQDHDKWVDFMMKFELGLERPDPKQAVISAFRIGASYAIGGLIPLSAYWFTTTPEQGLLYSSIITVICLGLFGYFKARFTAQNLTKGVLMTIFIGVGAAAAAFGIAKLVK